MFANSKRNIHSSYVYGLCEKVIYHNDKFLRANYIQIESIRELLLNNKEIINTIDLGAGKLKLSSKKKINFIIKNYSKSPKQGQLLYRLVKHFNPKTLLELGTSLGISTIYQSLAMHEGKIITIEGCPQTASFARRNFDALSLENIELIVGHFDEVLSPVLENIMQLDYVFFDGNHTKNATINYFEKCLPLAGEYSLFVFDDIHWSRGMEEAWAYIKKHPQVTITIDLFFMGLVFFRKEQVKQDFIIRF